MKPEPIRTTDQNRLMWQMLTDWASQDKRCTLDGDALDAHDFKELLMAAFKRETRLAIGLEGKGVVFLSRSTSRLSKPQMIEFLTFIEAEGLRRGIVFRHVPPDAKSEPVMDHIADIAKPVKSVQRKLTRAEVMAKARAAKANKKDADKPIEVRLVTSRASEEQASQLPTTTEGYMVYAQNEIRAGRSERWFFSREQVKLRENCKVGTLGTQLLQSLIKELA